MKLYELPQDRNTKVYIESIHNNNNKEDFLYFHHIDGMYSYCTTEQGDVCHLFAGTEIEPYKDGFIITKLQEK